MQQNLPDRPKQYRDLSDQVSDRRYDIETLKPVQAQTSETDLIRPIATRSNNFIRKQNANL